MALYLGRDLTMLCRFMQIFSVSSTGISAQQQRRLPYPTLMKLLIRPQEETLRNTPMSLGSSSFLVIISTRISEGLAE